MSFNGRPKHYIRFVQRIGIRTMRVGAFARLGSNQSEQRCGTASTVPLE